MVAKIRNRKLCSFTSGQTYLYLAENMRKGGKRNTNMEQGGRWFAHVGMQHGETTREACTSTGAMLSQTAPQQILQGERYPKVFINPEQKTTGRNYTFSVHDNRATLQYDIDVYNNSLGRRKCLDDRRQHNSHFELCHDDSMSGVVNRRRNSSGYQDDYIPKVVTEGTHRRRFPKNHLERSQQAALVHTGECFMWFGRNDLKRNVEAASSNSLSL